MAEGGPDPVKSKTENHPKNMNSHNSQNYVENVSVEVCHIMHQLGYGEEIRRRRTEKYRERDRLVNALRSNSTFITAGSKAEGLTSWLESDLDFLNVDKNVICVETGIHLNTIPFDLYVFRMDTRAYPGHSTLLLARLSYTSACGILESLCDNGSGGMLLSSRLFQDNWSSHNNISAAGVQFGRAGPALTNTYFGLIQTDWVPSLRCHCPSILQRWAARPRHWPLQVIVQKVVSFGAYVTPVGHKESQNKQFEWRICFNSGETELVNNLNDTQAKVYVMLKMILKDVLRPGKKEITSYVMKNIVLWQAERSPQNTFHARSLFHWLHEGLRELRTAIVTQHLSYYMIPERNLMAGCGLQDRQKSKWVEDITGMMAEGPRVILRLPKIRRAVVASPEPWLLFSRTKIELELLHLEFSTRTWRCIDGNGVVDYSDAILQEILKRRFQIMTKLYLRMFADGSAFDDVLVNPFRICM